MEVGESEKWLNYWWNNFFFLFKIIDPKPKLTFIYFQGQDKEIIISF